MQGVLKVPIDTAQGVQHVHACRWQGVWTCPVCTSRVCEVCVEGVPGAHRREASFVRVSNLCVCRCRHCRGCTLSLAHPRHTCIEVVCVASSMDMGGTVGVEGTGGQVWVSSTCMLWARIYTWSTKAMSRLRSIAISKGKVPVEITYLADMLCGCGRK